MVAAAAQRAKPAVGQEKPMARHERSTVAARAMRRALIVGIDDYPSAPLAGCVNDATAMERLLRRHDDGGVNFDTQLVTSDREMVTRARLRAGIDELFADQADVALLYFSGHGTENDLGGYLVTSDATLYDEGVSLADVLALANRAKHVREAAIIIDSCHSGWLGTVPAADNAHASLREGLSILSASRASQPSLESGDRGVFTQLVCSALDGGAADLLGNVSVAGIYAHVDQVFGAWDQRPLFKSHVSRMLSLRTAKPAIDVDVLRRLPDWFETPYADFPLSPRHEHTAEPRDTEAEGTPRCLQRCNRVKLVEPIDVEDMYFAAINATGCRLTALGRFYWELAKRERI
jgi:Caspase domain